MSCILNSEIRGAGIGLRSQHALQILDQQPKIAWLEVLVDNWMAQGGLNQNVLMAISERYPMTLHGVGLSLGSVTPLDCSYIQAVKALKQQIGAQWYSEHASFSHVTNRYIPDLLPLPYTQESISHLSQRIIQVQDMLGERILLENVSAYIVSTANSMSEGAFLAAVVEEADCYLLLDINNVMVSCYNLGQDPVDFFSEIPVERIKEIHLAGYENKGEYLLDAHNQPVTDDVWEAYHQFISGSGPIPTLIEWDNNLPELSQLLFEQKKAQQILELMQESTV